MAITSQPQEDIYIRQKLFSFFWNCHYREIWFINTSSFFQSLPIGIWIQSVLLQNSLFYLLFSQKIHKNCNFWCFFEGCAQKSKKKSNMEKLNNFDAIRLLQHSLWIEFFQELSNREIISMQGLPVPSINLLEWITLYIVTSRHWLINKKNYLSISNSNASKNLLLPKFSAVMQ